MRCDISSIWKESYYYGGNSRGGASVWGGLTTTIERMVGGTIMDLGLYYAIENEVPYVTEKDVRCMAETDILTEGGSMMTEI